MPGGANDETGRDRVVIVTGGSRGLGREIALELTARGFAVVVGYARDQRAAERVVDDILGSGGTATAIRGDVADELDVERLFTETLEAFGGVDVVVNAFGGFTAEAGGGVDVPTFDTVMRTAGRGTFVVDRQAARHVRDGGRIVNLAGPAPDPGSADGVAHAAGVAAIAAITRTLATELRGRSITVNAVVVGPEATVDTAGITGLVAFLAGPAGRAVTGQVIASGDRGRTSEGPGGDGPTPARP